MRLLLYECVPYPIWREFVGHDTRHVVDMGWSSKRKGELLRLMVAEGFEAFPTVGRNPECQQNLCASDLVVVLAIAKTNCLQELRPLVPPMLAAIAEIKPGQIIAVGG